MTPEKALLLLSGAGRRARIGPIVHRGVSAVFYQACVGRTDAILRIDRAIAPRLGLDRFTELQLHNVAADAGLAPEVIDASPDHGILLTVRVDGRHWSRSELADIARIERVGQQLRALHGLRVTDARHLDFPAAAARYASLADAPESDRLLAEIDELSGRPLDTGAALCLCHNDLNLGNIVIGERVSFIDFEYAALGDPLFDTAVAIRQLELDPRQRNVFVRTVLGGTPSLAQMAHVSRMVALYDRLALLWWLALRALGALPAGWRDDVAVSRAVLFQSDMPR